MQMELRMLIAIVLSFLVFFLYQVLFVEEPPVPAPTQETAEQKGPAQTPSKVADEGVKPIEESPLPLEVKTPSPSREGRTITVSTSLYVATFTENGGGLKGFRLKRFRESLDAQAPMKEVFRLPEHSDSTLWVSFMGGGLTGLNAAVFEADSESDTIDADETKKQLGFSWTSPDGVTIIKTYTFFPHTYELILDIKVRNRSAAPIENNLTISLLNGVAADDQSRYVFTGPAALVDGELREIDPNDLEDEGEQAGRIGWVAYEDRYFASAIIPKQTEKAGIKITGTAEKYIKTTYIDPSGPVPPQNERVYQYGLYFGPKSLESLGKVGADLGRIVDFGFFDIIAKPFLHAMNFIYRFIPNYGVVIILITIIVKILFWPLSNKSYQSMSQMKKLQPKMAEIRAKYKHDKKMMNQEIMGLYRLYKVNPLGGCLPMVLQIPVFFAFYKMLYQAIELRHAPFFLWINDLSAPDRLFNFNVTVPLMAPPYGIPVLTLIMGASMFFQQKMSPPPGDPTQAKMMMFMPIFFTFIFINFPSGLVLYWLVNNILSMAQQYYVTKKTG